MGDESNRKPVEAEPKLVWLGALLLDPSHANYYDSALGREIE